MEAMVHDKPHKRQTFAKHCSMAFVLGTFTEHYRCWKFWMVSTRATRVSGTAFFKHKYLSNPIVTPEDQIIAAAVHLTNAIQGTITANMRTSTLKLLGNLQSIFHNAAKGYDTHQSKAEVPIRDAVQHHTPVSPQTPNNNVPTKSPCAPPRVQPNVTPNIARNLFGGEPLTEQMLPNTPKGGIQSLLHVRHNALPNPNSPDKQLQPCRLQQVAEIGHHNKASTHQCLSKQHTQSNASSYYHPRGHPCQYLNIQQHHQPQTHGCQCCMPKIPT